jgi:hypothetical protein
VNLFEIYVQAWWKVQIMQWILLPLRELASQKTNTIMPPWVVKTILLLASRWGSWPGGGRGLSPSTAPGFESSCARLSPPRCLTYPLGLQGVQWAVRLVVVRASWPGHPRKSKKKILLLASSFFKKKKKLTQGCLKKWNIYWGDEL